MARMKVTGWILIIGKSLEGEKELILGVILPSAC